MIADFNPGETCQCDTWGSELHVAGHHVACALFDPKPFIHSLHAMVRGMNAWAADEDGIHPDAWAAYTRACDLLHLKYDWCDG